MRALLFSVLLVTMIHNSLAETSTPATSGVQPSSPSSSAVTPQESFPIWTPCKDCRHVWYLTCKTPGKKGCIVNGREVPWSEFVKKANKRAEVVAVERLRDGTVVVWFKW